MHPVFIDGTDLSKYEQAKRRFIDANETCRNYLCIDKKVVKKAYS